MKDNSKHLWQICGVGGLVLLILLLCYIFVPKFASKNYTNEVLGGSVSAENETTKSAEKNPAEEIELPKATHVKIPDAVKAVYMSSWVAGTKSVRGRVVDIADTTEVNSIVIDIKDYTGKIAFEVSDPYLQKIGSSERRIADVREFINELHKKNIYVIGRVAVFQDPYMVKTRPDLAVKTKDGKSVWKDHKGISWIDAGAKEHWDYTIAIAKESYKAGFDEINFDYIRFPSDGNMRDISYPFSEGKDKSEVIREFFEYLHKNLQGTGMVTSADLFGMVTTNKDDLNIGQVLEKAFPYFDFIAPMVYPSHYPTNFNGYKNPAAKPYEIIQISMSKAVERAKLATTSPLKLRPWLQDFDLGADYTADMVRAQIKATYDVGLTSWMMWDPSNKYTKDAFLPQ